MKKVIFASVAVAMLTACSNDEVVPVNNQANAISFGVTAENNSRAVDVFCNNNPFEDFNVYATYEGKMYIDKDQIHKGKDDSEWKNLTGLRYWPNEGPVTFYGYVNGELDYTNVTAPTFKTFTPDTDVAKQVDLLYARKTQKKDDGTKVDLNFRHALSQIVFNARNDNSNLYVEIEGVSIVKVAGSGVYSLPTEDTEGNLDHNYGETAYPTTGRGSWNLQNVPLTASYTVALDAPVAIVGNKTAVNLTDWSKHANASDAVAPDAADKSKAMLLIPQKTDKFNIEQSIAAGTGSYFLVKCLIKNVAGTNVQDGDVILWGETQKTGEGDNQKVSFTGKAANVMIPVSFDWKEGKKYLYTFVFGNGNGGYDPDPENPTPDPVLVPITFDVQIDDFFEVDVDPIETGLPETK